MEGKFMSSANEYRDIAQDCLRMAVIADDKRDRPLWVTMAQSWIQLAEHVSRLGDSDSADDNRDIDGGDNGLGEGPDWSPTPN
jgi:hypothetical protein